MSVIQNSVNRTFQFIGGGSKYIDPNLKSLNQNAGHDHPVRVPNAGLTGNWPENWVCGPAKPASLPVRTVKCWSLGIYANN